MNRLSRIPLHSPRAAVGGFTLVEMMVSISILLVTVLLFSQAIGGISSAWRGADQRMNNHAKARALLGRLRADIDALVLRPDLVAFPASPEEFGFYTLRRGVDETAGTDARALSYVTYDFESTASSRLLRKDLPFTYAASDVLTFAQPSLPPVGGVPDPALLPDRGTAPTDLSDIALADGVLGFSWAFLKHDGTFSRTLDYLDNGKARTATALVVAMAVMDDRTIESIEKARPGFDVGDLKDEFTVSPPDGSGKWDPKSEWNDKLGLNPGSSGEIAQRYPSQFVRGIRTFERIYTFPNAN